MSFQITNNASTTLVAGIASNATSLTVPSGKGALFPQPSGTAVFRATIVRASDNAVEIVECTARSTDTLTITRAQEGTTALTLLTGDAIRLNMTAAVFAALVADTTNTATTKATPVDADIIPLADSAGSPVGVIKGLTWANAKATLKTYFDTLYSALASVNLFTKAQRGAFTTLTDASTVALDLSLANNYVVTLAGNRTLGNPTNAVAGQQGVILVHQDQTGSRTLAYAFLYGVAGGSALVLSTPGCSKDMIAYSVDSYFNGTATITIATPGVVTATAHGLFSGDKVQLTTTGALPTGLSASTTYYARVIDANTFNLCTSLANAAAGTYIATSGSQSGTHTLVGGGITLAIAKAVA